MDGGDWDHLAEVFARTQGPFTVILSQVVVPSFPAQLLPSDPYRSWYRIDGPTSGNAVIQWDTQTNIQVQGYVSASSPYEQNYAMHAGIIACPVYVLVMPPASYIRATYTRILPAGLGSFVPPASGIRRLNASGVAGRIKAAASNPATAAQRIHQLIARITGGK